METGASSPAPVDVLLTREVFGNVPKTSQLIFYVAAAGAVACFCYGVYRRVRLWRLGQPRGKIRWQGWGQRLLRNVLLQGRMVTRSRVSTTHRLLFGGFAVLFIGTILIAVEHLIADLLGRDPSNPVFHKGLYFAIYEATLDLFGLAMLVGCIRFMRRRWKAKASIEYRPSDWIVLGSFLSIGVTGYLLEGLRIIEAETPLPGLSFVGYAVASVFELCGMSKPSAAGPHYWVWWLHAVLALAFIAAFPYTRLMHSIAGALNLTLPREPLGYLPIVTLEELEETGRIGVGEIQHFYQTQLLQLDACVSCGRCEDVCPAFEAGKPLSPRTVVQDLRRQLEAASPSTSADAEEGASLHGDVIAAETLWSCTTCAACADVCPLGVSPLGMISDMRRHLVGEGQLKGAPAASLQKVGRSGNPWGLPPGDRFAWAEGLDVPTVADNPTFKYLYWVGCAASYDRQTQIIARTVVRLFKEAQLDFAVLGPEERCTGESARRMGDEFLFQELAQTNVDTLAKHNVRKIVVHCPHCFNSFRHDYPLLGGNYEVIHHSQLISELAAAGRLPKPTSQGDEQVAFHDPCYLARVNEVTEAPRQVLAGAVDANALQELPRSGRNTACCGGGGGRMWFDDSPQQRSGQGRVEEIIATGVDTVAVSCPFCMVMLRDGMAAKNAPVEVKDISEIYAAALEGDADGVSHGQSQSDSVEEAD